MDEHNWFVSYYDVLYYGWRLDDLLCGNANILQAFTEAALIALGVYIGLVIIS